MGLWDAAQPVRILQQQPVSAQAAQQEPTRPAPDRQVARVVLLELTRLSRVQLHLQVYCSIQAKVVGQDPLELGLREVEGISHRYRKQS
jgi:hypothetical protein